MLNKAERIAVYLQAQETLEAVADRLQMCQNTYASNMLWNAIQCLEGDIEDEEADK
jgi:hypothetical protein